MLRLESVGKTYHSAKNICVEAVKDFTIELKDTGLYSILGPSGCGKTTLMNMIGTLDSVSTGRIILSQNEKEIVISELKEKELDEFRNRQLGFIFQKYNLIDGWSVEDNIGIVLEQQKWAERSPEEIKAMIADVLSFVGLEGMESRRIWELSGGQQQRVAIARALIKKPTIILADEPTGNLDYENSQSIMSLLKKCAEQCLVVVVTHDHHLAELYSDHIIQMRDGRIFKIIKNDASQKNLGTNALQREEVSTVGIHNMLLFRMSINAIWVKKAKLFLMLTIMLIILGGFKLVATLSSMDIGTIISKYLTKNKIMFYDTYERISVDVNHISQDFILRNRPEYKELLIKNFGEDCHAKIAASIAKGEGCEEFACELVIDGQIMQGSTLLGELPQKENEIVISDYMANELGLSENCIGKTIIINENPMVVCGIEKIDAEGTIRKNKQLNDNIYELKKNSSRTLVSSQYYEFQRKQKYISVPFADITERVVGALPEEMRITISGSSASEHIENFLFGRLPNKPGEIAISLEYGQNQNLISYDEEWIEYEEMVLEFWDLSLASTEDDRYADVLDGYLNLHSIMPEISIVGIFYEDGHNTSIVLADVDYASVVNAYCDKRISDSFEVFLSASARKNTAGYREIYQLDIKNNMNVLEEYVSKYESYKENRWIYSVVMIAAGSLLLLLMILFFSFNVRDNYQKIGIMRSLGLRYVDIARIWLYEALVICLILEICSVVVNYIIIYRINHNFMKRLGLISKLILISPKTEVAILLAILVLSIATVLVPIWYISDRKPIDLMKSKE